MAEDDSDDRLLAQDALRKAALATDVHFVEDGVELMDYLNRRNKFSQLANTPRPGLIILELNMPQKGWPRSVAGNQGESRIEKNSGGGVYHFHGGHGHRARL